MPITTIPATNALAALDAALRRAAGTPQPTVAELVALATADGDFFNDITLAASPAYHGAEYAYIGAEVWEDRHDVLAGTVSPDTIVAAGEVLARLANDLQRTAECDAIDARADAYQAGDVGRDGSVISYPQYRSV
jgi:hypothetical protein